MAVAMGRQFSRPRDVTARGKGVSADDCEARFEKLFQHFTLGLARTAPRGPGFVFLPDLRPGRRYHQAAERR